jgi:hypothetical protein
LPLYYLSGSIPNELKKKLFSKGVIQLMVKILGLEDKQVRA